MEINETSVNMENVAETPIETEVTETSTEVSGTEEVATPQTDVPVQSAEENAKFAKIRREAEAKAEAKAKQKLDSEIAKRFSDFNIHTYDDYLKAIDDQRESDEKQEKINKLLQNNIPEEFAKDIVELTKYKEKDQAEKEAIAKEKAEQLKKQEELKEFQGEFKGKSLDDVPKEVWELVSQGKTLADAYARYEVKVLKAQLNQVKTEKENSQFSPGNVGTSDTDNFVLTEESIEKMSPKELMKRWPEVKKIMKMK